MRNRMPFASQRFRQRRSHESRSTGNQNFHETPPVPIANSKHSVTPNEIDRTEESPDRLFQGARSICCFSISREYSVGCGVPHLLRRLPNLSAIWRLRPANVKVGTAWLVSPATTRDSRIALKPSAR